MKALLIALLLAFTGVVERSSGDSFRLVNTGNYPAQCYIYMVWGEVDSRYLRPGATTKWYRYANVDGWECI